MLFDLKQLKKKMSQKKNRFDHENYTFSLLCCFFVSFRIFRAIGHRHQQHGFQSKEQEAG